MNMKTTNGEKHEDYLQSDGYEDAVYNPGRQSESSNSSQDLNQDGFEVPVKAENVITYDIESRSPVELTMFSHPKNCSKMLSVFHFFSLEVPKNDLLFFVRILPKHRVA